MPMTAPEDRSKTSEAQLRDALDAMPHKVWMVRPNGPGLYYNRAMRAFAGDALNLPDRISRERALIHADDLPRVRVAADQAIADSKDFELELRLRDPSGGWLWHRLTFSMMWSGGRVEAWLVTGTDIHALHEAMVAAQESSDQLRLAAEAAQLGTFSFDRATHQHEWSLELKAIFGLPPDAPAPDDVAHSIHPEDRERWRAARRASFDPLGSGTLKDEHRILRPDGSVRWVLVKGRVSFAGEGVQREPRRGVGFVLDITERKEAEARQMLLVRELQHRTKNLLAVVQSIATSTLGHSKDLKSAQEAFVGRLHALAHAQEFVAAGPGAGVPLGQLVEAELAPFATRASIDGEAVVVGGSFAQMFALVVHELATNAAKHGSLSTPRGHVAIAWKVDRSGPEPVLRFSWTERGGPPAAQPKTEGLGSQLISLLGKSQIAFKETGFEYALEVPLAEALRGTEEAKPFTAGMPR
jgi:PAS domain S-box-containing protein